MLIWLVLTRIKTEEVSYERLGSCVSELVSVSGGRVGGCWNCIYLFGGLLLRGSNTEKWGDHQKKKRFINNSFESVISVKEKHQGLLKLQVPLLESSSVGKNGAIFKRRNFSWSGKITYEKAFKTHWNLIYLLEGLWIFIMKKKWGGYRRKRFLSEMWGNTVWWRGGLWKSLGTHHVWRFYGSCWIRLGEYYLVDAWLDFVTKLQKYTPFAYSW